MAGFCLSTAQRVTSSPAAAFSKSCDRVVLAQPGNTLPHFVNWIRGYKVGADRRGEGRAQAGRVGLGTLRHPLASGIEPPQLKVGLVRTAAEAARASAYAERLELWQTEDEYLCALPI